MFARIATLILLTSTVAAPAFAAFEDEAAFGHEIADYYVADTAQYAGAACSHPLDLLDDFKDAQTKAYEGEKSLLTVLTGITPTHFPQAALPVVACN